MTKPNIIQSNKITCDDFKHKYQLCLELNKKHHNITDNTISNTLGKSNNCKWLDNIHSTCMEMCRINVHICSNYINTLTHIVK